MRKKLLPCVALLFMLYGCYWPPSREVSDLSLIAQENLPAGYVVEMTSDDPTYAYTPDNPVPITPGLDNQISYLRHLRCPLLEAYFFSRRSDLVTGPGGHILTIYDLHCGCGRHAAAIFIDGHAIGADPARQLAPMGIFWHK